ncbi:PREDICTED: arabinogalactan peptide 22-like [Nelumbo nucifera]|uniref:Arabinogalactan peptide 22-like n=2 Tax=Nelumbo nucifera TaxID=4432 RepID=A0A1U8Q0V3_NELNU|nr:PREDICTED: arabinogalactan peptide 22-like [Nelumbo nucifera]DAD44519.1 TPA_asm: hypothetical protein HUJ06_002749 [Nelumbo nucifera]
MSFLMELVRLSSAKVAIILALFLTLLLPVINAQSPAPAPSSDGVAIDQGIAYMLMLAAMVLTYIIH